MLRIAVFASGNGSNAENLIRYFQDSSVARVVLVLSNNKKAGVLERAHKLKVATRCFDKTEFTSQFFVNQLKTEVDLIVLAGFLWLIPNSLIAAFPHKIVNIHPALLPKYGGKGMYGMSVHRAVKENKEDKTGITIHYVNEKYDEGTIIFQISIAVCPEDTPEKIAEKVHELEYRYFPVVVEAILRFI